MAVVDTAVVDPDQHTPGTVGDRMRLIRLDLEHVPLILLTRVGHGGGRNLVGRAHPAGAFADRGGPGRADRLDLTAVVRGADVGPEVGVCRLRDHYTELPVRDQHGPAGVLDGVLGLADVTGRGLGVDHVVHQRTGRTGGVSVGRDAERHAHQRGSGETGGQAAWTGSSGHETSSGAEPGRTGPDR